MIPYIPQPQFRAVGLTFYAFGFLAATALLVGWRMLLRRAQRFGLDRTKAGRLTLHMLWWGYYGSHVLYLLLFQRADLVRRPWRLLNPLDGIYSFGGIVCGVLAVIWFAHRYKFTRMQFWRYLDVAGFVFPFSWTIARTGCALAHDHVGAPSTSWIAVRFPEGPRLDLGLIEALFTAGLVVCFLCSTDGRGRRRSSSGCSSSSTVRSGSGWTRFATRRPRRTACSAGAPSHWAASC